MATLRWTAADKGDPGTDAVVLGSRLELRSYRHVPTFLTAAIKVRRQVRAAPGALGVSLIAELVSKTFWTLSAWTDEEVLDAFVRAEPHSAVMKRFGRRLARADFTTWTCPVSELPSQQSNANTLWHEAERRLVPAPGEV